MICSRHDYIGPECYFCRIERTEGVCGKTSRINVKTPAETIGRRHPLKKQAWVMAELKLAFGTRPFSNSEAAGALRCCTDTMHKRLNTLGRGGKIINVQRKPTAVWRLP